MQLPAAIQRTYKARLVVLRDDDNYDPNDSATMDDHDTFADKYDIASLGERAAEQALSDLKASILYNKLPVLETIPRIYAVTGEHNRGLRDVLVGYARLRRTRLGNGVDSRISSGSFR
ncbi:MAG: hypothetical protein Q9175_005130 [Cornicularia normoerica]